MGTIPSHLQNWDDWRTETQRRRSHTAAWIAFGMTIGLVMFNAAKLGGWIH